MNKQRTQTSIHLTFLQGFSLIEIMLVLAIATLIMILGIRQYTDWQNDLNVRRVNYNVDALFQAMQFYYKAECYGTYNNQTDSTFTYGTLNPFNPNLPTSNLVTLDIQQDLVTPGYLTIPYPFPENPLVEIPSDQNQGGGGSNTSTLIQTELNTSEQAQPEVEAEATEDSYSAQFIIKPYVRTQAVQNPSDVNNPASREIGQVGHVMMQVAVKLETTDPVQQFNYLKLLDGDCLAASAASQCDTIPGTGQYVIWLRMPSMASSKTRSDFWMSNTNVANFTRMYTTYPTTYLTGTAAQEPSGQSGSAPLPTTYQGFLCGD